MPPLAPSNHIEVVYLASLLSPFSSNPAERSSIGQLEMRSEPEQMTTVISPASFLLAAPLSMIPLQIPICKNISNSTTGNTTSSKPLAHPPMMPITSQDSRNKGQYMDSFYTPSRETMAVSGNITIQDSNRFQNYEKSPYTFWPAFQNVPNVPSSLHNGTIWDPSQIFQSQVPKVNMTGLNRKVSIAILMGGVGQ
ncbi:hypothetical protein BT69DRAFT_1300762 [Atractiella rhizophila]|nr:hypothetical protein BT69DRAFT_1300762 [Atractiella rhizophila]